jgi:hypothetical protein
METGIFQIAEAKNGPPPMAAPAKASPRRADKLGLVLAEYADDAALHFYVDGRENYWSHF